MRGVVLQSCILNGSTDTKLCSPCSGGPKSSSGNYSPIDCCYLGTMRFGDKQWDLGTSHSWGPPNDSQAPPIATAAAEGLVSCVPQLWVQYRRHVPSTPRAWGLHWKFDACAGMRWMIQELISTAEWAEEFTWTWAPPSTPWDNCWELLASSGLPGRAPVHSQC